MATASSKNRTNSWLVWRGAHRPTTLPLCTSKAANSETVPCRTYSTVCRSGRAGCSGSAGWVRSRAWIAVFSSTQKTAVLSGGCKYKPRMYVYDTALRIGAKLGVFPKEVYLHAGTRVGARKLGLDASKPTVKMSFLPTHLRTLRPHEVEDVLCIF